MSQKLSWDIPEVPGADDDGRLGLNVFMIEMQELFCLIFMTFCYALLSFATIFIVLLLLKTLSIHMALSFSHCS